MLAAEHPECLHSLSLRLTPTASQRYLTADVGKQYGAAAPAEIAAFI